MRRLKRKLFIIAGIILILGALGVGAYFTVNEYTGTIAELREEVDSLTQELDAALIPMAGVTMLNQNIKSGAVITEDMISFVEIPEEVVTEEMINDPELLIGKLSKINMSSGTIFTSSLIMDRELQKDERELDIVFTEIPIGLEPGDYIDVRISFPLGQDYIGMTKKRVVGIYDNVLKLIVSENDIYTYESMKTDMSVYSATKLYSTRYVEAGIQDAAQNYYPVSNDVLKVELQDPNIDTSTWKTNMDSRLELELSMTDDKENEAWPGNKVEKSNRITSNKNALVKQFESAKQNYERLQEQKAKQAAKEAK